MPRHAPKVLIGQALELEAIRQGVSHKGAAALIRHEKAGRVVRGRRIKPHVSQATFSRWVASDLIPSPGYYASIALFLQIPETEVAERCAQERLSRGPRGVRRANTSLDEIRSNVAELRQMVLALYEQQGLTPPPKGRRPTP